MPKASTKKMHIPSDEGYDPEVEYYFRPDWKTPPPSPPPSPPPKKSPKPKPPPPGFHDYAPQYSRMTGLVGGRKCPHCGLSKY